MDLSLPVEIIFEILRYSSVRTLLLFAQLSTEWKDSIMSPSSTSREHLWIGALQHRYAKIYVESKDDGILGQQDIMSVFEQEAIVRGTLHREHRRTLKDIKFALEENRALFEPIKQKFISFSPDPSLPLPHMPRPYTSFFFLSHAMFATPIAFLYAPDSTVVHGHLPNNFTMQWLWSPDMNNWMPLNTTTVSGGLFDGHQPVPENQRIIQELRLYVPEVYRIRYDISDTMADKSKDDDNTSRGFLVCRDNMPKPPPRGGYKNMMIVHKDGHHRHLYDVTF
eukprot:TRINITY_DN6015_c0_g1_i2.p1 TRINITY_DN6015_c0_g1~~TRINITY_DN6015_c0_g1_i2.p1  ORF type:complete len:280 (-),score=36.69 TRINITY_DN6015_c0_g1_i2:33-872(-)